MKTNEGKKRFVVLKFLIIVLGAAVLGFFGGFGVMWLRETVLAGQAGAMADVGARLARALPWVSWVVHLALTLAALVLYLDCRARFQAWDGEEEDLIEGVEHRLGVSMLLDNLMMLLGFLFFTLLSGTMELLEGWQFWLGLAAFLYCMTASIVLTRLSVNLTKRINPEKRGDVLELKFQQTWLASCDEGERAVIYQSAFKAYKVASYTCMGLWLVCTLAQVTLGLVGPAPGVCVLLVWLALNLTYTLEALRLQRRNWS